ncbi:hypothetical protein BX661DRAFT_139911, partial [Kickxella alabastrina]|uniref:uncharacterized protein n=1 Tax=Kickxella alabastrina TaxID=61397 RepID=UPI00221F865A
MLRNFVYIFLSALALPGIVNAHISLSKPCPRFSEYCGKTSNLPSGVSTLDGNINQPIGSATTGVYLEFCKTSKEWVNTVDTLTAGSSYQVTFASHAVSHSGGHCEFSVSYDSGKTFVVIHQELRYCFVGKKPSAITNEVSVFSYTFDIPSDLPSSDRAIFAWTWVNASGNREFYMNCADVEITGSSS